MTALIITVFFAAFGQLFFRSWAGGIFLGWVAVAIFFAWLINS